MRSLGSDLSSVSEGATQITNAGRAPMTEGMAYGRYLGLCIGRVFAMFKKEQGGTYG